MANEITYRFTSTGSNLYAVVLNSQGGAYRQDTGVFETPAAARWTSAAYCITLTEASTTQIYRGNFPAVGLDAYQVLIFQRSGGSPATTDSQVGSGFMPWSATREVHAVHRIVRAATATAGAANSITLDAGASATDNAYTGMVIKITGGTGAPQERGIFNYVGATKQAVPNRAWLTNPDNTSVFEIVDDLTAAETVFGNQQRYLSVDGSGYVTVATNNDKTGYALTLAEETAIASAVANRIYEGTLSLENMQRIMLAAVAGLSNSHQLGTPKYRDVANTKDRISATTDVNGNRTAIALDGS